MNVKQNLSILFFPKNQKLNKQGKTTLYIRITIDGLKDEFSSGIQILPDDWNAKTKTVYPTTPNSKQINKKLGQIKADLERHFDLVQAKDSIALPQTVIAAYQTPINGKDLHQQKLENLQFSEQLDTIILEYVSLCKKMKRTKERMEASPEKIELFEMQKEEFKIKAEKLAQECRPIFDNDSRVKTLMLTIDEYLLHFLQLTLTNNRSENSLEKWIGRKKRYLEFLNYRFSISDISLAKLEFKFLEELKTFNMVQHCCEENTATKYAQCIKEMMGRAVSNKWVSANIFSTFKCSYSETNMNWMTLQDMEYFARFNFSKQKYNEIRDIYVAMSFLGYAYADIHGAEPEDTYIGMDNELWMSRNRQKTGQEEALPILPIVKRIFENYKNHPVSVRKNRLLPVPSNQEFNRCLKEMGNEIGYKLLTEKKKGTHRARYFMVNEVLHNNGVPIKTTGKIAGQKSIPYNGKICKT